MRFNTLYLRRAMAALLLAAWSGLAAAAGTVTIELNTSGYGSNGWIDIQFNSSPLGSVSSYATLSNFVGWGDSSTAQLSNVTGSLASGYTIENVAGGYNDLFHEVNYSSGKVRFSVSFSGDADPSGLYGSVFSVALYGADQMTLLGNSSSADGSLVHVNWTPAAVSGASGSSSAEVLGAGATVSAVPEAQTWAMLTGGLALLGLARRRGRG